MCKTDYRLPVLVAGATLLVSIAAFRSYLPYVGDRYLTREPPAVVLEIDDVYLVGMGDRTKLWSLNVRRVEIGRDRAITTLSGISDGKIFDKGKTVLKVRAGRAIYDERREDLKLSSGIEIAGTEGQRVVARGAHWNSHSGILAGVGQVSFASEWGKATADDLIVDLRKKELTMRNVFFSINIGELENSARSKGKRDAG